MVIYLNIKAYIIIIITNMLIVYKRLKYEYNIQLSEYRVSFNI